VEEGMDTSHFIGAYDIDPFEHMQVQATCQKYVCNSISKTINMNADYPVEKLNELLLEYGPMIKGTTLYREGCKGVEILTPVDHTKMSREEILKIASN
jgi:ribonucleoside-diphosphate reductase alpha chain